MPPATATAGHMPGQDAVDLSIVLQLLKKLIVLIPLAIMFAIFVIRKVLVFPDDEDDYDLEDENIMKINLSLSVGDQNFHHINGQSTSSGANIESNANYNLTFKDFFLSSHSGNNSDVTNSSSSKH